MGKEQELVQSIRSNDVESFRKVVAKFKSKTKKGQKKSSLHIVDHDGFIPLHHAALSGNGEIVMGLLEFVTDVNAKDKKGMTPLHLAAWAGKVEPALLLLDAGAETNLCSRSGATPLHLASEHGNYGVVERLVDHDCDPTVVNNKGETALDLACRFGHLEVVRILLNNSRGKCEKLLNPKEFQEKFSPLHMAAKTGHFDVVKLLVEAGADINQRGPTGTCLHEAALYGKTDVVKYLLEAGIDVNVKNREGQTALDMVTQFTKSGASSEIKHLLREASLEVVYAKAIKDYANITDDSFLTLRMGDIVLVLDRRKDGMWKGCVRDDQKERIGFFPSSVVKILRSPSRNSVKRSSSSSSEASKVSTIGTVSNTFEIVTVAPPNQPVANKSRAPRMSSFRKKANRPESEDRSARAANSGEARRNNGDRPPSESDGNEKKKKLNYLDIVVVESHNKKSGQPVPASNKTEYADVYVPKATDGDTTDSGRTGVDNKDVVRTNETQKSVRVNGSYARLGKQVFGTQGPDDNEKLRQELQRQQEERLKRQLMRIEQENSRKEHETERRQEIEKKEHEQPQEQHEMIQEHELVQQQQEQQQLQKLQQQQQLKKLEQQQEQQQLQKLQQQQQLQKLQQQQQQQQLKKLEHQQEQPCDIQTQESNKSSSDSNVTPLRSNPPLSKNLRHNTMSSLVTNSPDLLPLPLKKRHSLSGGRPSETRVADPALPPKLEKKFRSALRADRRGTSPPPPPPPPPSGSSTPSPVVSDASPFTSPRSSSPTLPPLPKPMEVSPLSPTLMKTISPSTFSKQPVPLPSQGIPPPKTKPSPPPSDQSVRSPSPSFPPPPSFISDASDNANPPPTIMVSNQLDVNPRVERSPSPPLPPPPENLVSASASSLTDLPPPPQMLMEDSPYEEHNLPSPPEMENSPSSDLPHPEPETQDEPTTNNALQLPTNSKSRSGYEDMTRLKPAPTIPENEDDEKGYVMITPVKRPASPSSSCATLTTSSKPLTVSSTLYENFTPLKTQFRNFEVRRVPPSLPKEGTENAVLPAASKLDDSKPEKPSRHNYENFEIKPHQTRESNESSERRQDTKEDSSEKLTSNVLPVGRVSPVPQVPPPPTADPPNLRMREYDELYDWLAQSKLLAYIDNFAAAGFDLSTMAGLTAEDLSEIQVTKTGHRKRLMSEAAKLSKPVFTYENNVPSWLKSLGLSRYEEHFIEGGFDDIEFLYDLTKEDLEAIGITKIGHQRKILMATKKLQQRELESEATDVNIPREAKASGTGDTKVPCDDVAHVGVTRVYADERVGEYAVPRVSHIVTRNNTVDDTDVRREFGSAKKQISDAQEFEASSQDLSTEAAIFESKHEDFDNTDLTVKMNGNTAAEDSTDGVKELAASFQHQIHEETAKARGIPPPVKPKAYKKGPPPVVKPKPKTNGIKINVIQSPTDSNSGIDFTDVIKEAEALSESGSEQSPSSTLSRDRKSFASVDSSLAGSQGSLNSESDELQREIRESLHRKPSSGSSVEDISKITYLTLSEEDLIEQQKREEELQKYQKEQSKTDSLFNDIQGMLENLNSELDDMFT